MSGVKASTGFVPLTPTVSFQGDAAELLERISDAFIAVDKEWRIVHMNGEAARVSGCRRQDAIGKTYWELFPESLNTPIERAFIRAARERVRTEIDSYYAPWSRWFHVNVYPGNDGGISVFFSDITERKRAEESLRQSEERFRAITDTTPEWVSVISPEGALLHVNTAGLRMIGASSGDEITGRNVYTLIAPEFRDAFIQHNQRVCSGERGSLEFEIIKLDGMRRRVESHGAPLPQPDGTVTHVAITHDITERKRREVAALLLTAIVDSSDDAIVSKTLDGIITSWNKSAERLFGYKAEEVVGKSITVIIPPDRLHEEPHILSRLRRGERIDHFETIRRCKDGTLLNISLTISPVKDATGKIIGASKIARDITEAKRAERAALLLSAIVDSSDDAIVSKDLNGTITSWNKGAERVFGYTADEVIGKSITIIIPPDRLEEEPNILGRLRRGERVDHFETVRRRKDGRLIDISLTISPVRDAQGNVIGASKIARDISGRKRTEEAIQVLNTQLTADLAAMTRMQQLSARLVQAADVPDLLGEILDAALAMTGADMGIVQLFENGALQIVAQRGFNAAFLDFFKTVHGGKAACGTALERKERVVIGDVEHSPVFAGTPALQVMLDSGARAVQSTPLFARSGEVVGIFSTHYRVPQRPGERELRLLDILARLAADLIERKHVEEALLRSEARFRQLADSMPQIVWTARPDGVIDYYNERWYEFSGFSRQAFGDMSWKPLVHPDDVQHTWDIWYASVNSGNPYRTELRLWDRNENRWRWFIARALPVRDGQGAIVKWFGTSTDIDEQKRVQEDLRRANMDLEQFAYSASHDLQEPLRSVRIYSELLASRYASKLDAPGLQFLHFLQSGATRMESLVRDLLEYTHVTRLDLPNEFTDANEALKNALANLDGAIIESGANIHYDPMPAVRVHTTHLRQIFQNLIGNAIKYRSPDRPAEIHVTSEHQNGWWLFAVRDNGIGIPPEYREYVFGLFKRLHSGAQYSGTGIGLAICQRIVERYGGRIWVESEPGQGSTFRFTIPSDDRPPASGQVG